MRSCANFRACLTSSVYTRYPATDSYWSGGGGEPTPTPAASALAPSPGVSSAFGFLDNNGAGGESGSAIADGGNAGVTGMDAFPVPAAAAVLTEMPAASAGATDAGAGGGLETQSMSELKQHESMLESLEQQCANIQTVVYQFEEARNQFLAAKSQLDPGQVPT